MSRMNFFSLSMTMTMTMMKPSRLLLAGALATAAFNACTCEDPDGPGGGRASLIAQFPNGSTLQSDGSSTLVVRLLARNAEGTGETSPITLTSNETGFFVDTGAAETSVTPNGDGQAEVTLQCEPNADGRLEVSADNGIAQTTFAVTCEPPEGDITIDVDDSDCDALQADGESSCTVIVRISQDADGVVLPQPGDLVVAVASVDPPDGDDAVLAPEGINAGLNTVTVTAVEVEGQNFAEARFDVLAPAVAETVTLELTFDDAVQAHVIDIPAFVNLAAVTFSSEDENVVGGEDAIIVVDVTGADGLPANGDIVVSLAADGNGSASLAAGSEGTVAVTNGTATLTLNTEPVTQTEVATVRVEYTFLDALPPFVSEFDVTINQADAVILNVAASPTSVESDDPANRSTEITVSFSQNDARITGGTVELVILDPTRLTFAGGASQLSLDQGDFDAEGVFTTTASATPDIAPGTVTIEVTGTVPGEGTFEDTVDVEVERAPILSSMTPAPPDPAVIGVRGSAFVTTTVVSFTLRDDRNDPMPNVFVRFAVPTTADRDISLVSSDVSDGDGVVSTVLSAGTIAGPVSVTAEAGNLSVQSPTIVIVGGLPNHQSSFMACGDAVEVVEGTTFTCSATLVDRFSNVVADQSVQFRSEGSGTDAFAVSATNGTAQAQLVIDDGDTVSAASVPAWSFGFIPRSSPLDASFDAGCFDNTVSTECDIIEICNEQANTCPLPLSCLDRAEDALALIDSDTSVRDPEIFDYIDDFRACGFPVACLRGNDADREGIVDMPGDECNLAKGCFDYSAATECPHDGLLTVIASTRGEEAFVDGNGNGVFDFGETRSELCILGSCESSGAACSIDDDCDAAIPVDAAVDLPEPFLDKNDNCRRDDLTNSPRLVSPSDKVRHTDLFNDVDGNNVFGFTVGADTLERNGEYDLDTEIFLQAHVLAFFAPDIIRGNLCATPGIGSCREVTTRGGVIGIDETDVPSSLAPNDSFDVTYRIADGNGNCASPSFTSKASVAVEGPIVISGDTELTFDQLGCGFASSPNSFFPQCEDLPTLGAPVGTFTITADCAEDGEDEQAEIKITDGAVVDIITVNVLCASAAPPADAGP